MLRELTIENLAIIEKTSVSFGEKLNVFTGETGAGKSILIGGINAVMGGRVSKELVRTGADKAVITGLFTDIPQKVNDILSQNGFSPCDELILQREISSDGKSTARINGRVTTAAIMRETALELVNIHGQHDNQLLMNGDRQRDILDIYGNTASVLEEYRKAFKDFSAISRKIKELSAKSSNEKERAELLRERLEEIDKYKFSIGEEDEINENLNRLRNFEQIQDSLYSALDAIAGDDDNMGAYSLLQRVRDSISQVTDTDSRLSEIYDRISVMLIELEDIREGISDVVPSDTEDFSEKLSYYEARLSAAVRFKRKYSCTLDELVEKTEQWRTELYNTDNFEDIIENLSEQKKAAGEQVKTLAAKLTEMRKSAAETLAARISKELEFLDMPDIRLVFDITQDKVTLNGMDNVDMLISVNKGEELRPLSKIASGGELSRIMLAIKNVLAQCDDIQTMIFDEIDTGISGKAAQKVGIKLHEAAQSRQILCVTHLAQIAAAADTHLLIKKSSDSTRTFTSVTSLDFEGRKKEIARIISGNENDRLSLENAEQLLSAF